MAGETVLSESKILHKSAVKVPTEFSNPRVTIGGEVYMHTVARDITDRKRAASALIESEQKYRDLVENAKDIFFSIDLNGRFIDVNEAFLREGSWSREDIIGNSFLKIIHPEDLPAARTAYERGTNKQAAQFEIRAKRKDGSYNWYSFVNRPLYDNDDQVACITGIARDIQARKQAEAALHRSEQRLRLLIDSSPDLIFLKDDD